MKIWTKETVKNFKTKYKNKWKRYNWNLQNWETNITLLL